MCFNQYVVQNILFIRNFLFETCISISPLNLIISSKFTTTLETPQSVLSQLIRSNSFTNGTPIFENKSIVLSNKMNRFTNFSHTIHLLSVLPTPIVYGFRQLTDTTTVD